MMQMDEIGRHMGNSCNEPTVVVSIIHNSYYYNNADEHSLISQTIIREPFEAI